MIPRSISRQQFHWNNCILINFWIKDAFNAIISAFNASDPGTNFCPNSSVAYNSDRECNFLERRCIHEQELKKQPPNPWSSSIFYFKNSKEMYYRELMLSITLICVRIRMKYLHVYVESRKLECPLTFTQYEKQNQSRHTGANQIYVWHLPVLLYSSLSTIPWQLSYSVIARRTRMQNTIWACCIEYQ